MGEVRRAEPDDVPELVASLARAFLDDPVAAYIFPTRSGREDRLREFFSLQLRRAYLPRGEVYTVDSNAAASLWMPPGTTAVTWLDRLAHLPLLPLLAGRFLATRRLAQLLASHHPTARHYYLGTIGTTPDHQGRGLGSALLRPVLDRCDSTGLPAYLECSRWENVDFYSRHGFDVTAEVRAPDAGPPLWLMWREPTAR